MESMKKTYGKRAGLPPIQLASVIGNSALLEQLVIQRQPPKKAETTSLKAARKRIRDGEDLTFIPESADDPEKVTVIPFIDVSQNKKGDTIESFLEASESYSLKMARTAHKTKRPEDVAAFKRTRTEALGEISAARDFLEKGYVPVHLPGPGHGTGIDQVYKKRGQMTVVEAKGPGAKLSPGQMERPWIESRAKQIPELDQMIRKHPDHVMATTVRADPDHLGTAKPHRSRRLSNM